MSVFWRPRGCVLWFDFATLSGSIAYDLSGQKNNGTIYGAIWKRGHLVGTLSFDGVDDYVLVPADPSLNVTSATTIMALVKSKDVTLPNQIAVQAGEWARANLLFDGGKAKALIVTEDEAWRSITLGSVENNKWYLITLTFDKDWGYFKGYLDITETKSPTFTPQKLRTVPNMAYIGHRIYGVWSWWKGDIAFVRIYNRALTEREIKAYYHYLTKPMARVPI